MNDTRRLLRIGDVILYHGAPHVVCDLTESQMWFAEHPFPFVRNGEWDLLAPAANAPATAWVR